MKHETFETLETLGTFETLSPFSRRESMSIEIRRNPKNISRRE